MAMKEPKRSVDPAQMNSTKQCVSQSKPVSKKYGSKATGSKETESAGSKETESAGSKETESAGSKERQSAGSKEGELTSKTKK